MQRTQDQWDIKADRIHGIPKPNGATVDVVVTGFRPSLADIVRLVLIVTVAQAIIGAVILIALSLLGVL